MTCLGVTPFLVRASRDLSGWLQSVSELGPVAWRGKASRWATTIPAEPPGRSAGNVSSTKLG
jgi:hypothetical protein